MLIHDYQGMKQGTIKRIGNNKTVARNKKWGWNKKQSKPSKCIITHPENKEQL